MGYRIWIVCYVVLGPVLFCSKANDMSEGEVVIGLHPGNAILGNMSVMAEVKPQGNAWEVIVIFTRSPEKPPMRSEDVAVKLINADGTVPEIIEGPRGILPGFGDGRGISVNARYLFRRQSVPVRLEVYYESMDVIFRLVSGEK